MRVGNLGLPFRVMLLVICVALALGVARPGWAGPILRVADVDSVSRSAEECGGHVLKVMRSLEKDRLLSKLREDGFGSTDASSVYAQCIFVGQDQQRRSRWIIYISIASRDETESKNLLNELQSRFKRIVRID